MKPLNEILPALVDTAIAAGILIRGGVIKEENYEACLKTWIRKNANNDAGLLSLINTTLSKDKVVNKVSFGKEDEFPHIMRD